MMNAEDRRELERWQRLCERIKTTTLVEGTESPAQREKRIDKLLKDPKAFCAYYFPKLQPMDDFMVAPVNRLIKDPDYHGWWRMFRGARKTTTLSVIVPMLLMQRENRAHDWLMFLLLVAASQKQGNRILGNLQAQLENNQRYVADFGHQVTDGHWRDGEFVTRAGHIFATLGMDGSGRGTNINIERPTFILATDLDSNELSRNPTRCKEGYNWLMEDIYGTFAADGPTTRFVYDNNYFSKTSIGHEIGANNPDWDIVTVNVLDKDGNPAAPWITQKHLTKWRKAGYRAFNRNYMNTPIEMGNVFKPENIHWRKMLPLKSYPLIEVYFDPSLSSKKTADYKAIRAWAMRGEELDCLATFCRQCSITEAVRWLYRLCKRFREQGATAEYWIESQFWNEPFQRAVVEVGKEFGFRLPLRFDTRSKEGKSTRIETMAGLYEQDIVFFDIEQKEEPDTEVAEAQILAFGPGSSAHDDAPDADEGAWSKLLRGTNALQIGYVTGTQKDPEQY